MIADGAKIAIALGVLAAGALAVGVGVSMASSAKAAATPALPPDGNVSWSPATQILPGQRVRVSALATDVAQMAQSLGSGAGYGGWVDILSNPVVSSTLQSATILAWGPNPNGDGSMVPHPLPGDWPADDTAAASEFHAEFIYGGAAPLLLSMFPIPLRAWVSSAAPTGPAAAAALAAQAAAGAAAAQAAEAAGAAAAAAQAAAKAAASAPPPPVTWTSTSLISPGQRVRISAWGSDVAAFAASHPAMHAFAVANGLPDAFGAWVSLLQSAGAYTAGPTAATSTPLFASSAVQTWGPDGAPGYNSSSDLPSDWPADDTGRATEYHAEFAYTGGSPIDLSGLGFPLPIQAWVAS